MTICRIQTYHYESDISVLLGRQFHHMICCPELMIHKPDLVTVRIRERLEMDTLCAALSNILLKDLSRFELERMVSLLPLDPAQKQQIFPRVLQLIHTCPESFGVPRLLRLYFSESQTLNLEGFLHFRMPAAMQHWSECIQQAMEELLLEKECSDLIGLMEHFPPFPVADSFTINLCIHEDGSFTLSDHAGSSLHYRASCRSRLIRTLILLSPNEIVISDRSGGTMDTVSAPLKRLFSHRIRLTR